MRWTYHFITRYLPTIIRAGRVHTSSSGPSASLSRPSTLIIVKESPIPKIIDMPCPSLHSDHHLNSEELGLKANWNPWSGLMTTVEDIATTSGKNTFLLIASKAHATNFSKVVTDLIWPCFKGGNHLQLKLWTTEFQPALSRSRSCHSWEAEGSNY